MGTASFPAYKQALPFLPVSLRPYPPIRLTVFRGSQYGIRAVCMAVRSKRFPHPRILFFRFGDRFRIACFPFAAETPVKTKPCTVFALRTLSLSALKKSACCGHGFRRPVLPTPSVGGSPVCTPIIPRIFGLSIPFLKIFKIFCERHSVRPFASHTPSYAGAQAKGAAAQNVFAEYASRQRLIAGKSEGVSTKSAFSSGAPFSVTMTAYSSFCRSKAAKTSNTVASPLRKT